MIKSVYPVKILQATHFRFGHFTKKVEGVGGRRGEDRTSVGRQEENKAGPVRVEVKAKAGLGWLNMCPGGFGTKQRSSKEVNASKVSPKGEEAPVPAPSPR